MTHPHAMSPGILGLVHQTGSQGGGLEYDRARIAEITAFDALEDHLASIKDKNGHPIFLRRAIVYGVCLSAPVWALLYYVVCL